MKLVEYFYKSIVFSLILNIIVFYTFAGCSGKNKKDGKKKSCCSGVNKNNDTEQNGEKDNNDTEQNKDNNEDEQNEDGKKADPYEAKKKELMDKLNNLDAENKKLNSRIEQDIDALKNKINDIKSKDEVTLMEFNLSEFGTSINKAKEKQEAENEKIKKIKEKNEKLKNALNGLIKSGGYENMKYDNLKKSLAKIKEDNYKDGFSEANIDADNKNLMTQIDKHIIATRAKEIDEDNKNKSKEEKKKKLTNLLNELKVGSKGKKSEDMDKDLRAILDSQGYKDFSGDNEIKGLVDALRIIIDKKKEAEKKEEDERKKKEDEERKKKEIDEKKKQLNDSLKSLTNIKGYENMKSTDLQSMLDGIKNNYCKDGFFYDNIGVDNKDLITKIEKDISNKNKEEQEIKKKNEQFKEALTQFNDTADYINTESTELRSRFYNIKKNYIKDGFNTKNLTNDNRNLILRILININKKKSEENKVKKEKDEEKAKMNEKPEIKDKNEQLKKALTQFYDTADYINMKSTELQSSLNKIKKDYIKDGFSYDNIDNYNKNLMNKILIDIHKKEKKEQEGENKEKEEPNGDEYSSDCTNAMYLTEYIYTGTDEVKFEIFLKNNGKKIWALDSKLINDPDSQLCADEILLVQQKQNVERGYKFVIKNLSEKPNGKYEIFFWFYTDEKIRGDKITAMVIIKEKDNEKNEMEKNIDKIQEFRDTFTLSKDDYSDEKIFEILKENDFNFESAFAAIFE